MLGKRHIVCSNHFQYRRPINVSNIPTYLKGYGGDDDQSISRPKGRLQLRKKRKKQL